MKSVYVVDEALEKQYNFVPKEPVWFGWNKPGLLKAFRGQQKTFTMACQLECQKGATVDYHLPGSHGKSIRDALQMIPPHQ